MHIPETYDLPPCSAPSMGRAGDTRVWRRCAVTHCNTLQHTATHCNTLQHNAVTHCNTLQHTATHCNTLQHTTTHCNTTQQTATHCNKLQHTATNCNTLQHTATHCNTLQHTLGCGDDIYRVAKMHRMSDIYRSFSVEESYNQCLFRGKRPARYGILCIFTTL